MPDTLPTARLPLSRVLAVVLCLAFVAAACSSSETSTGQAATTDSIDGGDAETTTAPAADEPTEDADDEVDSETTTTETMPAADGPIDITGLTLAADGASCADHVGEYTSMITDQATGTEFEGMLTISTDGSTCTFDTNQIPNHDTGEGSRFATDVAEVPAVLSITATPEAADTPSEISMGANVLMLNGVKWEAYPAACFGVGNEPAGREAIGCGPDQIDNPWRYNIGSPLNDFGFDIYFAHVQPGGLYHYHSTPTVLYDIECEGTAISPVIGFAADGFPLYGPCFEDETGTIRAAQSSYQLKEGERSDIAGFTTPYVTGNVAGTTYDGQFIGDHEYVEGSGDLDACNGMTVGGQYGYYVTSDYPYVVACFTGTPSADFR